MRQWTIDAFAAAAFKGNPACVVEPFTAWPDDGWMQSLAAENNQAETAFLLKTGDTARFGLRWFTPAVEVRLCGHATLAAGHGLFTEMGAGGERLTFDTRSGVLTVTRAGAVYEMDFPADPPTRIDPPAGLAEAMGIEPVEVWAGQYLVALLDTEEAVRALTPDIPAITRLAGGTRHERGALAVTAQAAPSSPFDAVSRFFAPWAGISEDPATGSLHCILSPLWSGKLGRRTLRYHQAYPGRGGDLDCEDRGDRILLRGRAVTAIESRLRV